MMNTKKLNLFLRANCKKSNLKRIKTISLLLLSLSIAACNDNASIKTKQEKPPENITKIEKEPIKPDKKNNLNPAQKAWLKKVKLGPYASETQDWEEIEAAAKKEGKVVIYSVSSRIFKIQEKFQDKYGIEIIAYDTPSDIQLEKLRRDRKQNIFQVDVLFNNDIADINQEFLPHNLIWNFVPDTVADDLNENEKNPVLVQRWTSRIFIYNNQQYPDGPPIDNIWDLTRPEWEGKFVLPDPIGTTTEANAIETILQHHQEMAAAYEAEFGEKLTISPELRQIMQKNPLLGEPNAGTEWLYRLIKNKPVLTQSGTRASDEVGYFKEPLGMTSFSKIRWVNQGKYQWQPLYNLKPIVGVAYPTTLTIADRAPHPNAAKLLIRFMMEEGFEPWNVTGDYAARQSIMEKQVKNSNIPKFDDLNIWSVDPEYIYENKYTYITLYRLLQ
ncbi:MAG: hypothetical protein QNJ38_02075 [Prochloraceae cyanobacterium]|nr:hypothetical protein [Prochloraceae cyanobacterium]